MKEAFFKINTLLIITSSLAIIMAIVAIFIDSAPEQRFVCGVVDVVDTTVYSPPANDSISAMVSYGEVLFKENCKSCHAVHTQEVGPALHGVSDRRSKKWIRQFIRDNEVLVRKKDTAAINLIKKFGYSPHTKFESLTNDEIEHIFIYIDVECQMEPPPVIYTIID